MSKHTEQQLAAIAQANAILKGAGLPGYGELWARANAQFQNFMKVEIEVKSVYGNQTIYPVNEHAQLLAAIAGTKTLTNTTLAYAERMGFSITRAAPKPLKEILNG
jgi:hypothetical protein